MRKMTMKPKAGRMGGMNKKGMKKPMKKSGMKKGMRKGM